MIAGNQDLRTGEGLFPEINLRDIAEEFFTVFFAAVLAGAVLIATSHVRRKHKISFGTMRRAFAGCVLMPFPVVVVFASVEGLFDPPDGQRIIIIQI